MSFFVLGQKYNFLCRFGEMKANKWKALQWNPSWETDVCRAILTLTTPNSLYSLYFITNIRVFSVLRVNNGGCIFSRIKYIKIYPNILNIYIYECSRHISIYYLSMWTSSDNLGNSGTWAPRALGHQHVQFSHNPCHLTIHSKYI